jgi:hypothetical protein
MDTSMTNSIVGTATALASRKDSDALNVRVLKKALDIQADAAATLIQAIPQPPALATSGSVGTKLHAVA